MPFLELTRPANSAMAAFAVWLGYSLALRQPAFDVTVLLLAAATFLVSAGGQAINDYFDREVDALRKPHRPIPSGRIKPNTAYAYSMLLFATGVFFAGLFSLGAAVYAVFFAALLYAYSAFLRKVKWIGNWLIALSTAAAIMFGAFAVGEYVLPGFLALAAFFANAGREITKDLEDLNADRGFKTSLAMLIGEAKARLVAGFCFALAAIIALYPATGIIAKQHFIVILLVGVLATFYALIELFKRDYRASQVASKAAMVILLLAYAAALF